MAAASLDIEFSKYWSQLTPVQKRPLLSVIKSFVEKTERISIDQYNQELKEAEYKTGNYHAGRNAETDKTMAVTNVPGCLNKAFTKTPEHSVL